MMTRRAAAARLVNYPPEDFPEAERSPGTCTRSRTRPANEMTMLRRRGSATGNNNNPSPGWADNYSAYCRQHPGTVIRSSGASAATPRSNNQRKAQAMMTLEVDQILDHRVASARRKGRREGGWRGRRRNQYLVKWKGFPLENATWELTSHFPPELIEEFYQVKINALRKLISRLL